MYPSSIFSYRGLACVLAVLACSASASVIDRNIQQRSIIPSPGMPSLASLGVTYEELAKRSSSEYSNLLLSYASLTAFAFLMEGGGIGLHSIDTV